MIIQCWKLERDQDMRKVENHQQPQFNRNLGFLRKTLWNFTPK